MNQLWKAIIVLLILSMCKMKEAACQTKINDSVNRNQSSVTFSIADSSLVKQKVNGIDMYYCDTYFNSGHPLFLSRKGLQVLLAYPTFFFTADKQQIPFFIYPNEKIKILYAGTDSLKMVVEGNRKRSDELNFFRELVLRTGNIHYGLQTMPYQKRAKSLDDFYSSEKIIGKLKEERLQLLDSLNQKNHFTNTFKNLAINCIMSTALYDSLLLFRHNKNLLSQQFSYNKLMLSKINSLHSVGFMPYVFYLKTCDVFGRMFIRENHEVFEDSTSLAKYISFVQKNFKGQTKNYLMFVAFSASYNLLIPISSKPTQAFTEDSNNNVYKRYVEKMFKKSNPISIYSKETDNLRFTDEKTVKDLKTVLSNYKGKVVVLDFWASWCAPCREEMPYSLALKKKFENKNVAFVYISIDDNLNDWLKANKELKLGDSNSFLLLNSEHASFTKEFNINAIPRYILIGKEGKIIASDAPRPSDKALQKLIEKNL